MIRDLCEWFAWFQALVKALDLKDMNELPLSLDISWFEQKAVAVLLSLLHLGVKNIRLGPRLPAFLTPEALQVLVDNFQLKPAGVYQCTLHLSIKHSAYILFRCLTHCTLTSAKLCMSENVMLIMCS